MPKTSGQSSTADPATPPNNTCAAGLVHCADPTIPELHRLARTVVAWRDELVVTSTPTVCPMGPPKQSTP
jgi:hypothetical protein